MATTLDVIFNIINSASMIFLYGWPFMILFILLIFKIRWRNWPLEAIIIERRGYNLVKTNDRIGKFTDPYTGLTGYMLQKAKETIPIVNFEWILHNVNKNTTLFDWIIDKLRGNSGTIFLFKYGTRQYKPIWIKTAAGRQMILKEIKDKNGSPILIYVYEQFDPRKHLGALDFEVIDWDNMNFMVQEQRASFERRQKKKEFWKQVALPLIALAVVTLLCIIMIKFSYDYAMAMKGGSPTPAEPKQPTSGSNIPVISDMLPAS